MRLYTNNEGGWAGTQADAKVWGKFEQVEVPTDKATLLEFLNTHAVGAVATPRSLADPTTQNKISPIDDLNLKEAFKNAGLTREYLRRVYDKIEEEIE
jgi:hypothetical protein